MSSHTVAFFGASGGVGLSALKHALAAGHHCIALCRTPSKLTEIFPNEPKLQVIQGNAHDVDAVKRCIVKPDGSLVDEIVTTIGSRPVLSKLSIEDPVVCQKGMTALLAALGQARAGGASGRPLIVAASTTGMSRFGRDIPYAMYPLYHIGLKVPHEDKRIMEDLLVESGEEFAIIRPSLLMDGETDKTVKVGIEDPKTGRESNAIGYTITREDAGKWIAQTFLLKREAKHVNKITMITT